MPEITKSSFVIAVPDLQKSAAFYRDVLGFTVHAISDPGWLFFQCGDCMIMAGECPQAIPPAQLGDHSYFAYLQIVDVDSLYVSVRAAGVQVCKTLRDEPWQMREFGLVTADGHRMMFGTPISAAKSPDPATWRAGTASASMTSGAFASSGRTGTPTTSKLSITTKLNHHHEGESQPHDTGGNPPGRLHEADGADAKRARARFGGATAPGE